MRQPLLTLAHHIVGPTLAISDAVLSLLALPPNLVAILGLLLALPFRLLSLLEATRSAAAASALAAHPHSLGTLLQTRLVVRILCRL